MAYVRDGHSELPHPPQEEHNASDLPGAAHRSDEAREGERGILRRTETSLQGREGSRGGKVVTADNSRKTRGKGTARQCGEMIGNV